MVQANHPLLVKLSKLIDKPLIFSLLLIGCLAIIVLPSLEGIKPNNWLVADNFDGYRYMLGQKGIKTLAGDDIGVQSTLATLFGEPINDSNTTNLGEYNTLLESFTELAKQQGYVGKWIKLSNPHKLLETQTPLVVEVDFPKSHLIIVLDIENNYLYAADPTIGNVLYPLKKFYNTWTGKIYQLESPDLNFPYSLR